MCRQAINKINNIIVNDTTIVSLEYKEISLENLKLETTI